MTHEVASNPIVFLLITAVTGFLAYQAAMALVLWVWDREVMRWQTRFILGLGVVIAAAVAVTVHDWHVHTHIMSGDFLRECFESPECAKLFEQGPNG